MNITVLFSEHTIDYALSISTVIKNQNCFVDSYKVDTLFEKSLFPNPLHVLDTSSHIVFLHDGSIEHSQMFTFLAGYALGKNIRVILIETEKALPIPDNCKNFGVILQPEHFEPYLVNEYIRYKEQDKKDTARSLLLERGISCFEDNFISIAISGDTEAVALFLAAGFSPSITDTKGNPILSLAVRSQFPAVVELLLSSGADVNRPSGDRGYSPLMDAVQKGDDAIATILLEHGADPNFKSKDGQTALIVCVGRGDVSLCKKLIDYKADPSISDSLGMSAKTYSKLFHNQNLVDLFN